MNERGEPVGKPDKNPNAAGTLVEPDAIGATNWMSPSFSPQTGLFYVDAHRSFSLYYAYPTNKPEGFSGRDVSVWSDSSLKALDYQTGKVRWEHPLGRWEDWAGVPSTAGDVVFTGDRATCWASKPGPAKLSGTLMAAAPRRMARSRMNSMGGNT